MRTTTLLQPPNHAECPCHSGKKYKQCCQPFHEERRKPAPHQVMRARYAAYALQKASYIMKTTHPNSPHFNNNLQEWQQDILEFCRATVFQSLKINQFEHKQRSEIAFVTFTAVLRHIKEDKETVMIERSEFHLCDGEWLYFQGLQRDFNE